MTKKLDKTKLKVELVRRGVTLSELARQLGYPATTLGSWVREVHPAPPRLVDLIEDTLRLPAGTLTTNR